MAGSRLTWHSLLERGHLPTESPKPFSKAIWPKDRRKLEPLLNLAAEKDRSAPTHYVFRPGKSPRRFCVPNPAGFIQLSHFIADEWGQISKHCRLSKLTRSRPVATKDGRSVVPLVASQDILQEHLQVRSRGSYLLQMDVAQCYPSIYTHAIAWALHGKQHIKTGSNRFDQQLYGNKLDKLTRRCQDGQTKGIHIGPASSYIIAEIVLCAVDSLISADLRDSRAAFRYWDEYTVACESEADGLRSQSIIRNALAEYELEPNDDKTKLFRLPAPLEKMWVSHLRSAGLQYKTEAMPQRYALIKLINTAMHAQSEHPADYVMTYLIRMLFNFNPHSDNLDLFAQILLQAAMSEPRVLPEVATILHRLTDSLNYKLDVTQIRNALLSIFARGIDENIGSTVASVFYASILLKIKLGADVAVKIENWDDPFVALLAMQADEKGLVGRGASRNYWNSFSSASALDNEAWLLIYESARRDWLPSASGVVAADDFFQAISDADVRFFNEDDLAIEEPDRRDVSEASL